MRLPVRLLIGSAAAICLSATLPAQGASSFAPPLLPLGEPTSSPASAPTNLPDLALVRVSLTSTSDWSVVQLVGARIVDYRVRSVTDGVRVSAAEGGWGLHGPRGGSAEIDAVVAMPEGDVLLRAQKGYQGATTATLRPGAGAPVTLANSMKSDPAVATLHVPRDVLAPAVTRPAPADDRRLALAFYYPWFSNYDDGRVAERPAQPRSATDAAGVLSMTQQARAHGVDGFVVSWSTAKQDGVGYDLAVRAAEQTGGVVAPYLETAALAQGTFGSAALAARVKASLVEVLSRAGSPAVLRSGGVPVVFAFETKRLPAAAWRDVLSSLAAEGRPVRLVGDIGGDWYANQWGLHQYLANDEPGTLAGHWAGTATTQRADDLLDGTSHLVTATVSPGFDNRRYSGLLKGRQIKRDNGQRYEQTWNAAVAADPDWMLITSWNEWFEGTSIEPGQTSGRQALEQTATLVQAWKSRTVRF